MVTAIATATLTRPVLIDWAQLQPGDQIDNTAPGWNGDRVYDTVLKVVEGGHDQDGSNEDKDEDDETYCEGNCVSVIFFEDEDCAYPMHVGRWLDVTARLRVEVSA